MKKIYHLQSCNTCKRIIQSLKHTDEVVFQDIKEQSITEKDLQKMYELSGSYEKLFNKRAQLYKQMDLKNKNLQESDYHKYILDHYTFLNRPVMIFNHKIFIGNSPKEVQKAQDFLANE